VSGGCGQQGAVQSSTGAQRSATVNQADNNTPIPEAHRQAVEPVVMYVAGLRFDTVALAETGTRWSTRPANEPDLNTFVIRHFPGL
jgi:hypothetical protein